MGLVPCPASLQSLYLAEGLGDENTISCMIVTMYVKSRSRRENIHRTHVVCLVEYTANEEHTPDSDVCRVMNEFSYSLSALVAGSSAVLLVYFADKPWPFLLFSDEAYIEVLRCV